MADFHLWPLIVALSFVCILLAIVLNRLKSASNSRPGPSSFGAASKQAASTNGAQTEAPQTPIYVYYGSQTGTAEKFAKRIAKEAKSHGFASKLIDLEDFSPKGRGGESGAASAQAELAKGEGVSVFCMATYGEGDPTDNALHFTRWIQDTAQEAGKPLSKLKYAVFGLGNRQYEHYNAMGKIVQARLAALGGAAVYPHGEGDDGADLEADFDAWLEGVGGLAKEGELGAASGGLWAAVKAALGQGQGQAGSSTSSSSSSKGSGSGSSSGAGAMASPAGKEGGRGRSNTAEPEVVWRVQYLGATLPSGTTAGDALPLPVKAELAARADRSSKHFFTCVPGRVSANRELRQSSGVGNSTRHVEIDLAGTGLSYTTADNAYICATNDPSLAAALAQALGLDLQQWIDLVPAVPGSSPQPLFPTPCTVADVLVRYLDLGCLAEREVLAGLACVAPEGSADRARLQKATSRDAAGKAEYAQWITQAQRSVGEVLLECTSLHASSGSSSSSRGSPLTLDILLALMPRLQARPYTIASSSRVQPTTLAVCVSVIDVPKPSGGSGSSSSSSSSGSSTGGTGRRLKGAASNHLLRCAAAQAGGVGVDKGVPPQIARLCPEKEGASGIPLVRLYVRPSTFHLPLDPSLPVILIGPGTGIAPMRAFLHERRWQRAQHGPAGVGPTVLFFGCRRRDADYIYADELQSFVADGTLTALHVAFSREGGETAPRRYVQHLLAEQAADVWAWIRPRAGVQAGGVGVGGGSIYVCGATAMGTDVHAALTQIVVAQGKADSESAALLQAAGLAGAGWEGYVHAMQAGARYIQELWSS